MLISISSSDLDSGRRPIAISDEFSEISILVSEIRRCENKAFPKKRPTYWDFESRTASESKKGHAARFSTRLVANAIRFLSVRVSVTEYPKAGDSGGAEGGAARSPPGQGFEPKEWALRFTIRRTLLRRRRRVTPSSSLLLLLLSQKSTAIASRTSPRGGAFPLLYLYLLPFGGFVSSSASFFH